MSKKKRLDSNLFAKFSINASQIFIIFLIWAVADQLQSIFNIQISSSILGFFLLLFLLQKNFLKVEYVEHGANILLAELLLFFIPPVVGIIQYQDLLIKDGVKILIVVFISTCLVMLSSIFTVRLLMKS
ncbi:CidA/LrgA family protein [Acinetobacter sp. CFCC 10889]|uniref:CidA/LrgA family protein n=1 Tax=Acinetobacter sp. CFCC 10889 TaxID=1775557 RepID=UPI000DCF735F|nr:CidA/LrgA family protein [Acinetobacter sp. CFCC 10889]